MLGGAEARVEKSIFDDKLFVRAKHVILVLVGGWIFIEMSAVRLHFRLYIRVLPLLILAIGVLAYGVGVFALLLRMPGDGAGVYFGNGVVVKQVRASSPLQPEDIILRVGASGVNDDLLKPGHWYQTLSSDPAPGAIYTLKRAGEVLQVTVPWRRHTAGELLGRGWALALVGLTTVGSAILVLAGRKDAAPRVLVLAFIMLALNQVNNVLPVASASVTLAWSWLFIPVDVIAVWFAISAALHTLLVFPEVKAPVRRFSHMLWLIHLVNPLLSVAAALAWGDGTVLGTRAVLFKVANPVMVIQLALGLAALLHTYRTSHQPIVRSQIRWILWGLLVAGAPWAALYALPSLFGSPWLPLNVTNITVVCIPIALAIAVFRYGLMEIDRLINRTLVYLLLGGYMVVIYLFLVWLAGGLVEQATGRPNQYLAGIAAALAALAVLNPLRVYTQRFIDRTFFQEQLDFDRVLRQISQHLSSTLLLQEVFDLLTRDISRQLGLSKAVILLLDGAGADCVAQGQADWQLADQIGVDAPLIEWLGRTHQPLIVYQLDQLPPDVQAAAQDLADAEVELCLPLRRRDTLLGLYLFGRKLSGHLFNRQEVDTLILLGHQAAAAIQNGLLYQQLEAHNRLLEAHVEARTAELRAERNRLDVILQNIVDGLVVTDPAGRILLVNPAFARIVSQAPEYIVGRSLRALFDAQALADLVDRALTRPGQVYTTDIVGDDLGTPGAVGQTFHALACVLSAPRDADDAGSDAGRYAGRSAKELGVITVLHDITHERAVDRMKTEFISMVSHELRTPLTSVLGFAKLISKSFEKDVASKFDADDRKGQRAVRRINENLQIIVNEGERLTRLINDVLDISKMEAGKVEWHMEQVAVERVIRSAVTAISSLAKQKGLPIRVRVADHLPAVQADPDRLTQVLTNLLSNAIKFTDAGQVELIARHVEDNPDGVEPASRDGWVAVSVKDSGIGIAPENLSQVFEKFRQVRDVTPDRPKGTGLGLPICQEIIEQHGGRIWVESELGVGSVFTFVLPIISIDGATQTHPAD